MGWKSSILFFTHRIPFLLYLMFINAFTLDDDDDKKKIIKVPPQQFYCFLYGFFEEEEKNRILTHCYLKCMFDWFILICSIRKTISYWTNLSMVTCRYFEPKKKNNRHTITIHLFCIRNNVDIILCLNFEEKKTR